MPLAPGNRLGPYEVTAQIGVGGMGEVYRATDTNLKRAVALKVLPASVASDAERLARFQREAEVLASLNHPNIAQIHGLEKSDGTIALVMELVEGPTLADRIAQGTIPVNEALLIAKQIAEALEAAHEQGIIHRDLKPANIKVRSDGAVKVLDFGLAKALEPTDAMPASPSMSPTITTPAMTQAGIILGTAAYMSPEQARGKTVDKRADIWAFGCVLFEMLTGRPTFPGSDISEVLAGVIKSEPAWNALPATTSSTIRVLLQRCLQKETKHRLHDIADARIAIDEALRTPDVEGTRAVETKRNHERLAWALCALAVLAATVALAVPSVRAPVAAPEMRLEVTTPPTTDPISFALSPDGRRLVFVASGDGPLRLWLRPLDGTTAQPLAGTEGAVYPFWSPDSRSVGFFAEGRLKRLDMSGGLPQTLGAATAARGGTWNGDGVILFANAGGSLFRIPASGGQAVAVPVTTHGSQLFRRFPFFLPGGRQFLFYGAGSPDTAGIYLGELDVQEAKRLTPSDTAGVYVPPGQTSLFLRATSKLPGTSRDGGWLLFARQGTLVAQRFDQERAALSGDPITLADRINVDSGFNFGAFSVSATGLVAYRAGGTNRRTLTWFGRSGQMLGIMGTPDESVLSAPQLSPDGRRVVVFRTVQGNTDIWLMDTARTTRFTFDASFERYPVWSPDGSRVVFDSNRRGHRDLYQKLASGAASEELLLESTQDKAAYDWSSDGRFILFQSDDPQTGLDLWILPLEGDRKPFVFLKTNFNEGRGQFSPDGRWVAYTSDESGRYEIYLRTFLGSPGTSSGQWQISTAGAISPRWSSDGRELYYIAPDSKLMVVPMAANGVTLEPGTPVALFQTRIFGAGSDPSIGMQYDVARDGRVLINTVTNEATSPITVILNWTQP